MLNVSEVNQELVRAFNINLRFNGIAVTNFTVQNLYGKDHIVISFDKNMDSKQCMKCLSDLKEKAVKASYKTEKVPGMPYNLQSFPFTFHKERLDKDDKGRKRFSVVIDEGVVFNLKCYLAKALARDIKEKMGSEFGVKYARERVYDVDFDRDSYLYSMYFDDQRLQKYFIDSFSAEIGGYENAPSGYLEVRGNYVHIKKSIFDDVEFIKDIAAYNASLECRYLQTPSAENKAVDKLKHTVIDFMDRAADVPVRTIIRTSHNGSNENSVLIPIVAKSGKGNRLLDDNDTYKINSVFNMEILSDVSESISVRLPKSDSSDGTVYGIDFADVDIAYCVLNKIIESSVINKDHELSIDPELRLQALSPVPNGPSSYLTESLSPTQEFPTQSHGKELEGSPRRGLEKKEGLLHNPVNLAGPSKGFLPSPQLNSIAVSYGVSGPSSSLQSAGAAANMPASANLWTQQPNPRSSSAPSAGFSSWNKSGSASTSAPSHWSFSVPYVTQKPTFLCDKDSDDSRLPGLLTDARPIFRYSMESGSSSFKSTPAAQRWSFSSPLPPPFIPISSNVSGSQPPTPSRTSSWKGANESGSAWTSQPIGYCSSQSSNVKEDCEKIHEEAYEKIVSGSSLSEKEEKLIEALLDMFNFNNYIDEIHTNFTLENEKIVGFLNVDREKYLQEVINDIIKKHCEDKEEARKLYDLDEFPFKFFSDPDYEKNQYEPKKTVVANISSGAVFNLKIHLIQELKRDVEDEVIKKLEKEMKMKKKEVRKCIRRSVHLEKVSNPTSYLCDISFSNEYFQNQSELSEELGIAVETLFKEFKNIYVEEFKSRLKKCNLDVSLVSHDGNMLHIKNAIDIKVVKKVKKCVHEEVPVKQFPRKEVIIAVPIVLQDESYILDTSEIPSETRLPLRQRARPIESTSKAGKGEPKGNQDSGYSSGFVTDAENVSSKAEAITSSGYESMDCENTRGGSPKRSGEEVVQAFKKQCIISTQIEDVTSESFGQRQGSIVG